MSIDDGKRGTKKVQNMTRRDGLQWARRWSARGYRRQSASRQAMACKRPRSPSGSGHEMVCIRPAGETIHRWPVNGLQVARGDRLRAAGSENGHGLQGASKEYVLLQTRRRLAATGYRWVAK